MKSKIKKIWFPVLLFLFFTVLFLFATYEILNQATTKIVTSYIDELAAHDMTKLEEFVSDRWNTMEGIRSDIKARNLKNIEEIHTELKLKESAKNFDHILLIDEQGQLYTYNREIFSKEENKFLELFPTDETYFVMRYDSEGEYGLEQHEYMLYGMDFQEHPITLEDSAEKFVAMVVLNDISKIRERMQVTSFGGRGYASVIDKDGKYIVANSGTASLNNHENFFEMLRGSEIEGISADEIANNVNHGGSAKFWCVTSDGVRQFVSVQSFENSDWNFITSLEESVFTDQTNQFIGTITWIIGMLLAIIFITFFVSNRIRKKLKNFYSSIVEGVYNKQYYNDKLIDSKVTGMAIVDLDHLKHINDRFGHMAGDQAIEEVALILLRNAGTFGDVFRFGGDEFVIAFQQQLTEDNFRWILENMLADIRKARLPQFPDVEMTFSIGGYYGYGIASEVLKNADDLLYEAKKNRNCIVTNLA